jgi:hypothetical protein
MAYAPARMATVAAAQLLWLVLPAACAAAAPVAAQSASAPKPNIMFVLADDLGYNEMGFMNSSRGLSAPACCPPACCPPACCQRPLCCTLAAAGRPLAVALLQSRTTSTSWLSRGSF